MQIQNQGTDLIQATAERMYQECDEYQFMDYQEALPRIMTVIAAMSVQELFAYNNLEFSHDVIRNISQVNYNHRPIHFGWIRSHNTPLNGACA